MPVKHKFVNAISDGGDATVVRPSNWNDDHNIDLTPLAKSIDYGVGDSDEVIVATAGSGSGITITLPDAATRAGRVYRVKRVDTGTANVTVATTSAQTIDGVTTYLLTNQWQYVVVMAYGSNWLVVGSN